MSGTPIIIPKTAIAFANLQRSGGVEAALRSMQDATSQPLLQASIVVGPKAPSGGGQKRRFTMQVVSHDLKSCRGQYALLVVVSITLTGVPAGVQTTAWITGSLIKTETADQVWLVYTNNEGKAELDLTVVGAPFSRWVRASVVGAAHGTDEVDFT